jgi:hypothetical protein
VTTPGIVPCTGLELVQACGYNTWYQLGLAADSTSPVHTMQENGCVVIHNNVFARLLLLALLIATIHTALSVMPACLERGSGCSGQVRSSDLQQWLDAIPLPVPGIARIKHYQSLPLK